MIGRHMRRLLLTPLNAMLVRMLVAAPPQQAFEPSSRQAGPAAAPQPPQIPLDIFQVRTGWK